MDRGSFDRLDQFVLRVGVVERQAHRPVSRSAVVEPPADRRLVEEISTPRSGSEHAVEPPGRGLEIVYHERELKRS
jgi:hypothetical protein